jgi:4-hydroxybenzoate polyprenyltransferase
MVPGMINASDISRKNWIERFLPEGFRPYAILARWDRPIGTWLLLFPAWWGLALASERGFPIKEALLFAVGAFVMRGAGCTINDMIDKDMDRLVARTANRPLASGMLSLLQAVFFALAQIALGFAILLAFRSVFLIELAAASLILIVSYPFMKRITYWPQAFLGLTFNWGALLGWAAVEEGLNWPAIFLYLGGIFWTLHYDTIYAHQDKKDDEVVGIKSTALLLGASTKVSLIIFCISACLFWGLGFWATGLHWTAYIGLALALAEMIRQIFIVNLDQPSSCLATFKANRNIGWILLFTIMGAHLLDG